MGLISGIKHMLGFGFDDENDNTSVISDDPEPASAQAFATADSSAAAYAAGESIQPLPPEPPVADPEMKARIFEGAVAIFNDALPDFIARSVDAGRQRQLLFEAIDKSVDQYLDSLLVQAERYAEACLRHQSDSARREAEKLRTDMQQLEHQRTSLREQQLSADRRRRALADRVADLETQLARVEAEREQFELENKSLLNKMKVAEIQPGIVEELQHEIERLRAGVPDTPQPDPDIIASLTVERDEARKALELANASLKEQHGIAQAMYADLQSRFAAETDARKAAEAAAAQANDDRLAALAELDDANHALEALDRIQQQMELVEDVIRKRDDKIARLKASNKRLKEQLAQLRADVERRNAAERDQGLFSLPSDADLTDEHRKIASELSAIEDDFECPDWFVAEPAPIPDRPELPEFGYSEPPKKKRPENDAQLSLF